MIQQRFQFFNLVEIQIRSKTIIPFCLALRFICLYLGSCNRVYDYSYMTIFRGKIIEWFLNKIRKKNPGAKYLIFVFIYYFSGVLVNLHHSQASNGNTGECGLINIDAIQQVVAAKWAVDVINNQSLPHELRIGKSTSTAVIR